ncbi:MAG: histidine phosphotransferase family protein [Pseudomonadota bacterium]
MSDVPMDMELAALLASKLCHDVISPVGAINNGLEVLAEDGDASSREYALQVIRQSSAQASAKLQFARLAYGAAGSVGATVDLNEARALIEGVVDAKKHTVDWQIGAGVDSKPYVKLLLNLTAMALAALPRGGAVAIHMTPPAEAPRRIVIVAAGPHAGLQAPVAQMLTDASMQPDTGTILAYHCKRLASDLGHALTVEFAEGQVVLEI